jgi:hypothetical protein
MSTATPNRPSCFAQGQIYIFYPYNSVEINEIAQLNVGFLPFLYFDWNSQGFTDKNLMKTAGYCLTFLGKHGKRFFDFEKENFTLGSVIK